MYPPVRGEMMSWALPRVTPISLQENTLPCHRFSCRTLAMPIQWVVHVLVVGVDHLIG